jgi:hypothetical protein
MLKPGPWKATCKRIVQVGRRGLNVSYMQVYEDVMFQGLECFDSKFGVHVTHCHRNIERSVKYMWRELDTMMCPL